MTKSQRKLWSIFHVIITHNIFRVTREKSVQNLKTKLDITTRIKSRIITDIEDVIRAEWHIARKKHASIKVFHEMWCEQMKNKIHIFTLMAQGQQPENTYRTTWMLKRKILVYLSSTSTSARQPQLNNNKDADLITHSLDDLKIYPMSIGWPV